jgi:predicted nucleotidyltransferase
MSMNLFEAETASFIELLNKNGVRFILVGGLAVNYYGYSRTTGDIDLWIDDSKSNREKLVAALKEFGIEGSETFLTYPLLAGFAEVLLNNGLYIDLMADLVSLKQKDFNASYLLAEEFFLSEFVSAKCIHIKALIDEKLKTGRAKDQEDAKQLQLIAERRINKK